MTDQLILEKTEGFCRTIILNRPKQKNAFNFELAKKMGFSLKKAAEDDNIRIVVLRGAEGVFSAGGDLKLFHAHLDKSEQAFREVSQFLNEAIETITEMPKPVVAAIEGPAYAAAFGVVLACDLVVASNLAIFSPSFIKIALSPNASSTYFLPRMIGYKRAMQAFMQAQVFSAKEAKDLGIVNYVWDTPHFEQELAILVEDISQRPLSALSRIKKLLKSSMTNDLKDQLEIERHEIAQSSLHKNFKEGVTAFIEKRKAKFN